MMGVIEAEDSGKYLGLTVLWKRSKIEVLYFVKDKLRKKMQGWKQNMISTIRKEVMIKEIASAILAGFPDVIFLIPYYYMQRIKE
ncbi:hypothetical protein K1719_030882 [Acacia pycnantha]|nr:hypothetical protein K1719_030882 [Acacia pycnantha]